MVSNVSFNGVNNYGQYSTELEKIAKFAVGSSIAKTEDNPLSGLGAMVAFPVIMETPKVINWARNAKENGGMINSCKAGIENIKKAFTETMTSIQNGSLKNADTYKNVWSKYSAKVVKDVIPNAEKMDKMNLGQEARDLYAKAAKWAERAQKTEKTAAKAVYLKHADEALVLARKAASEELIAKEATGILGKISKALGFEKLGAKVADFATKSPTTAKLLKYGKSGGAMFSFAIEGGLALFTQVIPTFTQLGVGKGILQTTKSAVKVGASVGGWTAGAALGAAIGSVIPGAGTLAGGIVGSVIGMIGGTLGAWGATKIAGAVVGKDELEIEKDKQAKELAAKATKDPQITQQLLLSAKQKFETEGITSEDAKIAYNSYNKIANSAGTRTTETNLQYSSSTNPFAQNDYMNKDFMATGAGLA